MHITVRRVAAVVGAVVLGGALFALAPAGAVVAPPSGTISCTIGGTVTIKPALTATPSKRALKAKAATTTGTCNNAGVNGGKAPITAVSDPRTGD